MNTLTRFDTPDGIELVIDIVSGESFATISGYARMSSKAKSTISERLVAVREEEVKTAELVTAQGLRTVRLIPGKLARTWLVKDNPQLLEAISEAGWTTYCHISAGFKISSTAIAPPPTPVITTPTTYIEALEALLASEKAKELLRIENEQLIEEVEELSETVDELFNYSSIIRIAKFNDICEKSFNWRKLKAASIALKVEVKKVPCPRYGTKNLYSHDAWRLCYPGTMLPETTSLTIKKLAS